jgi:RNA polymerase sigma-70 factor (sigma-E family)
MPMEFQDFVQARWPSLVRYGYLLTGDRAMAEDVAQTALERTWRRWASIRSDRPDAYVRRAMAREAISRHRARQRQVPEQPIPDHLELAGGDGAESRAARDVMRIELSRLPPRMRAVVVLRVWEDLPESQVAEILGCSTGSVKSQLSRAMARLRRNPGLRDLVGLRVDVGLGDDGSVGGEK